MSDTSSVRGLTILYHPGDELDETRVGVDVLACPAHAPWDAMKETVDFARSVGGSARFSSMRATQWARLATVL